MDWIRVTTVLLALAAPVAAAVETGQAQDRKRIVQALATPAAAGYAREIAESGARRDAGALATALERIADDASLDDTARTALMHDTLVALAAADPDPALKPVLERHASAPRTVEAWHDDEGHRVAITIYDTGAAAKYASREWRRTDARHTATEALARGSIPLDPVVSDAAVGDGYADAFEAAPVAQLARARDGVADGLARGLPVERMALVTAIRLQDRALALELLERGRPAELVHALGRVRGAFPAQDAFSILRSATARADIGAAAVAEIGRQTDSVPAARVFLLDSLGDIRLGAAAAAALAADGSAVSELILRLEGGFGTVAQVRAAIALNMNGSPAAVAALERALSDPGLPESLHRAIAEWLR